MVSSTSAKFLTLLGAFTFLWFGALADGQSQMSSTPESSMLPSFEELNISTDMFEIKFINLHLFYKMAVFSTDKGACDNAFLFVFIPTRPASFEIREAIRSSWVGDRPSGVVVKFIIGLAKNSDVFFALLEEQNTFGDMIFYDIYDTYDNLYLKVHAAFNWQQTYCSKAEYILKTDDDTIVDLHRLLYWIEHDFEHLKQNRPAIIFGSVWKASIPVRDRKHKWYISKDVFPDRFFPNYTNGATYMLSNEAVSVILGNTEKFSAFTLEDVLYTGVVSAGTGIHREDIMRHFRRGGKILRREHCNLNDNVPFLTAIYGNWAPEEFAENYKSLKAVRCKLQHFLKIWTDI